MNYPVESQVVCPFAFANRELTRAEQKAFLEGKGLPVSVGVDPAKVLFEYRTPDGILHTLTYGVDAAVTKDAVGAYKATLTASTVGRWKARGRGLTSGAEALSATKPTTFRIIAF